MVRTFRSIRYFFSVTNEFNKYFSLLLNSSVLKESSFNFVCGFIKLFEVISKELLKIKSLELSSFFNWLL